MGFGRGEVWDAEREVLLHAWDVAHVEYLALVRGLRADWVSEPVCEGELGRGRGVVCWEMAAGDERAACRGGKSPLAAFNHAEVISARGRGAAGGRAGCRGVCGREVEEEEPGVDLPEAATADEHLRPGAGLLRLDWLVAHERLLAGYETHAFELL